MTVDWPSFWLGVLAVYGASLLFVVLLAIAVDIVDWHAARKRDS